MLFVENYNTDPYCNHALEEWLMENYSEDCFMLWRNQKAILLGKNQNAYNEINMSYVKEHDIKVVRRITGGGAVFTDEGNIMFTFISGDGSRKLTDFYKFVEPILSALQSLGVPAEFAGRNDMVIKGKKFSGNAQCVYNSKLLHHGTLMYSADTGEMTKALNVSNLKLQSKGVASVKSRVTNISDHMLKTMDIEDFRAYLFDSVFKNTTNASLLRLSEEDWAKVKLKAANKYATTEWIYGRNPDFNVQKEARFSSGIIQVYLNVVKGRLKNVKIFGDFFGDRNVEDIEIALTGVLYDAEAIRSVLAPLPISEYFSNISLDELVNTLVAEAGEQ